jgi:hypothetical protein
MPKKPQVCKKNQRPWQTMVHNSKNCLIVVVLKEGEKAQSRKPITEREAKIMMKRVNEIELEFDRLREKKQRGQLTEKDNRVNIYFEIV